MLTSISAFMVISFYLFFIDVLRLQQLVTFWAMLPQRLLISDDKNTKWILQPVLVKNAVKV